MTREQRNERQRERRRIRRAEDAAFRAREAAEAKLYRDRIAGRVPGVATAREPQIITVTCPDCLETRQRETDHGVRPVSRCVGCRKVATAIREAARRKVAKAAAADRAARTRTCISCCQVYMLEPRGRRQSDRCPTCRAARFAERRAAQQAARVRARSPRHVTPAAPAQVIPAEPRRIAPVARIAVVPCLETYIEQRRVVSVLGAVRELGGGLRLVRVHVWGELRPRDLAVERLGVAA